jgi:ATP-dependent DNA ligase
LWRLTGDIVRAVAAWEGYGLTAIAEHAVKAPGLEFKKDSNSVASRAIGAPMLWRTDQPRWHSSGFIAPCLPTKATEPPCCTLWLHEIKHDGFRVIARKDGNRVRLYSRPGNDLTWRFPLIVDALAQLRPRSVIIDGEAVACDDTGVPDFERLRYHHHDDRVVLCAFDLIKLQARH